MSATIHHLRPAGSNLQKMHIAEAAAVPCKPQPKSALAGKTRKSPWPLPCGRDSRWKKPLGKNAIRRVTRVEASFGDDE
jgi:hypothetical protein